SDLPWGVDDAYPWSDLRNFVTRSKPPPAPPTPPVVLEAFDGSIGVMLCMFTPVADADHYKIQVQELDPSDLSTLTGWENSYDFPATQVVSYTEYVFQTLGGSKLPPGTNLFIIGLEDAGAMHAYQWRVQACDGPSCSAWSEWGKWGEVFP